MAPARRPGTGLAHIAASSYALNVDGMPHALIVDDDMIASGALAELVADQGFTTVCADSVQAARDLLASNPDVILLDLVLPDGSGIELLREATSRDANAQVVVITGHASLESSIEAMRHGATDYLLKPINLSQLRGVLSRVARPPELSAEVKDLRSEHETSQLAPRVAGDAHDRDLRRHRRWIMRLSG